MSDVPGVLFSAGGWTGNAFHEFTDVLIPLFVTTERYHRRVRLFVSDAPEPWLRKYRRFLKIFTEFPVVILGQGEVSWCLSELTVGLEIHGYLTADPEKMPGGVGLARMSELYAEHLEMVNDKPLETQRKLRMGIVHRGGSGRVIENQDRVIQIAEEEGFEVEVLSFSYDSPSLEVSLGFSVTIFNIIPHNSYLVCRTILNTSGLIFSGRSPNLQAGFRESLLRFASPSFDASPVGFILFAKLGVASPVSGWNTKYFPLP